jgi:hypothetical protein
MANSVAPAERSTGGASQYCELYAGCGDQA